MIFEQPFGHKWCCNKALKDVTFLDCEFIVNKTSGVICPEEQLLTMNFINCRIAPTKGFEDLPLIEVQNLEKIVFDNTEIKGFTNPRIIASSEFILEDSSKQIEIEMKK